MVYTKSVVFQIALIISAESQNTDLASIRNFGKLCIQFSCLDFIVSDKYSKTELTLLAANRSQNYQTSAIRILTDEHRKTHSINPPLNNLRTISCRDKYQNPSDSAIALIPSEFKDVVDLTVSVKGREIILIFIRLHKLAMYNNIVLNLRQHSSTLFANASPLLLLYYNETIQIVCYLCLYHDRLLPILPPVKNSGYLTRLHRNLNILNGRGNVGYLNSVTGFWIPPRQQVEMNPRVANCEKFIDFEPMCRPMMVFGKIFQDRMNITLTGEQHGMQYIYLECSYQTKQVVINFV